MCVITDRSTCNVYKKNDDKIPRERVDDHIQWLNNVLKSSLLNGHKRKKKKRFLRMTTRAKKKNWRGKKNVGVVVVLYPINMSCWDEQNTSASPLFSPPYISEKGGNKKKKLGCKRSYRERTRVKRISS